MVLPNSVDDLGVSKTKLLLSHRKQSDKVDAAKILPPPSAVIEHDNAKNSYPRPETSQSTGYNAPVEQVGFFSPSMHRIWFSNGKLS